MPLKSKLLLATSLSLCGTLACSADVLDLGNNAQGPVYAGKIGGNLDAGTDGLPATPIQIVSGENDCSGGSGQRVEFAVDSGHLFWISATSPNGPVQLHKCTVDNCAATVIHSGIPESPSSCVDFPGFTGLHVDHGTTYWVSEIWGPNILSVSSEQGAPIRKQALSIDVSSLAASNGILYISARDGRVFQCDSADCGNTLRRFAMVPSSGIVAEDSEHLYLNGNGAGSGGSSWLRVAKDVNANFELLAQLSGSDNPYTLKVGGDTIYWLESVLFGQVKSCPTSGCVGTPTAVVSGLAGSQRELAVDDTYVYILTATLWNQTVPGGSDVVLGRPGQILRCPLVGCSKPEVIFTSTNEFDLYNLVVDDRFIYFAGDLCDPNQTPSNCNYIAVIAK